MKNYKLNYALFTAIIVLFSVILSSCTKEELVNPPKVTLTTDWTNRTEGVAIPSPYTVVLNNKNLTFYSATNTLPELEAGTYPVTIYNSADKVTIIGSTATVVTSGSIVDTQPGWFFFSSLDAIYENDKEENLTAVMQQQIRLLNIELTITDGDINDVESVTASLSGVANTMNLKDGTYSGNGLSVMSTLSNESNKLTTSVRLIGLTSEPQQLTINITYKNGANQEITSDVSSLLAGFEKEKHKPLTLKCNTKLFATIELGGFQIGAWEVQQTIDTNTELQYNNN